MGKNIFPNYRVIAWGSQTATHLLTKVGALEPVSVGACGLGGFWLRPVPKGLEQSVLFWAGQEFIVEAFVWKLNFVANWKFCSEDFFPMLLFIISSLNSRVCMHAHTGIVVIYPLLYQLSRYFHWRAWTSSVCPRSARAVWCWNWQSWWICDEKRMGHFPRMFKYA